MLLIDAQTAPDEVRGMIREMEQIEGVKYVLGLESAVGPLIPEEILPQSLTEILKNENWELLLVNSESLPWWKRALRCPSSW